MPAIAAPAVWSLSLVMGVSSALAQAPPPSSSPSSWTPPAVAARCPSKWGAADERGAANQVTPASVAKAATLIKSGEIFELGRVLSSSMPLFAGRTFNLLTKRTNGPLGGNKRYSNEEIVTTELGQVGTQFDTFSHQGIDGLFYNCVPIDSVATRTGFQKFGIEKIGALFARGVLVDVAAFKGVDMLTANYEITAADLQGAIAKQGLTLAAGDAILIHTGWGKLWDTDTARYGGPPAPGIGVGAATWLASQNPLLIGADTTSVEIAPNPDKTLDLPVHQLVLVVNGIFLLENLKLDDLAAKKAQEFAFIIQPLKIRGGTGSTVAPIAVR
jgi:kynurenine formamidase